MKRVLALMAAVAMVAGAVVLRSGPLGGGDGDDDVSAGGGTAGGAETIRLHCAGELTVACELLVAVDDRIELTTGAPGQLADLLLGGEDPPADVWLAPRPWVELVRQLGAGGVLGAPTEVLARSPLVLATFDETAPECGGEPVGWRCIGDAVAEVRPGIQGLDDSEGLFTVAQAGTAYFGSADYATNDFDVVPEGGGPPFVDWATTLLRAVPRGPFATPLANMVRTGDATYDLAASVEAVATSAIAGTREEGSLRLIYPAPMATVDVVAAPIGAGDDDAAADLIGLVTGPDGADALAQAGWRVEGGPVAVGIDPAVELGPDDGLPEPGVLAALRDRLG